MSTGRRVVLVIGILLALPAVALLVTGGIIVGTYGAARDDDGYFTASLDPIATRSVAVTTKDLDFGADPGGPGWALDRLDVKFRISAHGTEGTDDVFVGIGRAADVERYLRGAQVAEVRDVDGRRVVLRTRSGTLEVDAPTNEDIWIKQASGPGRRTVTWEPTSGHWTAVLMNADGSPGVSADVKVGVEADFLLPLGLILGGIGLALGVLAVVMIVAAARGGRGGPEAEAGAAPPVPIEPGREPVTLFATIDPQLSRWQWLVKWFLAIPHFFVLLFLWAAFFLLTVVAGFAILFTGRYPRGIFDFNVGVMRWSWRVNYYATSGGLGTDRYPPFTLHDVADYPARLDVAYPGELSRGLVLVKWWLLAIPHYIVLGVLLGGGRAGRDDGWNGSWPGLITILVVIAAITLLFRKRYPRGLFDLIVGLNRWVYRVVVYAALMTDRYPPFRLDQGGKEPAVPTRSAASTP